MRHTSQKVNSTLVMTLLIEALSHPLVLKALNAAHDGFDGKTRKLPKSYPRNVLALPYVTHVIEVFLNLVVYGYGPEVLAAALLHDHLEDLKKKGWTVERMRKEFGDIVTDIVVLVTKPEKGTWAEKAESYRNSLQAAADELKSEGIDSDRRTVVVGALAVCAADKCANMHSSAKLAREGFGTESYLKNEWDKNYEVWEQLGRVFAGWIHPLLLQEFQNQLARNKRNGLLLSEPIQ